MFADKEYIAKLLYDAMRRNNGEIMTYTFPALYKIADVAIVSEADYLVLHEALDFLVEQGIAGHDSRGHRVQVMLNEKDGQPPDDQDMYPWEKKTNLGETLSLEVLRDLYDINLNLDED